MRLGRVLVAAVLGATALSALACAPSRPVAGPPLTTCDPLELRDSRGAQIDLTGEWTANDQGDYKLRQDGNCLTWVGLSAFEGEDPGAAWISTFRARIDPDRTVSGAFLDVHGGAQGSGTLRLRIDDDAGAFGGLVLTMQEATGHPYGGSFWERVRPDEGGEPTEPPGSPGASAAPGGSATPRSSGASERPSDEPADSPTEGPPQTDG